MRFTKVTLTVPTFPLWAWLLMITLGNLHVEVPVVPALSYWTCFCVSLLFVFVPWDHFAKWTWKD